MIDDGFDCDSGDSTITTSFSHTHFWDGLFFDVIGYQNIEIWQFEIMCWLSGTYTFTVALFNSSYGNYTHYIDTVNAQDPTYWTNIYTSTITCSTYEEKHNLTFTTPVSINSGTKQAFAFEWTGLLSQSQRSNIVFNFGDVYANNNEIGITVGVGLWSNQLWFSEVMCTTVYYGCSDSDTNPEGCTLDTGLAPVNWENILFGGDDDDDDGLTPSINVTAWYTDYSFEIEIEVRSDYIVTSKYPLTEQYYMYTYKNTDHDGNLPITYVLFII